MRVCVFNMKTAESRSSATALLSPCRRLRRGGPRGGVSNGAGAKHNACAACARTQLLHDFGGEEVVGDDQADAAGAQQHENEDQHEQDLAQALRADDGHEAAKRV